MCSGVVQKPPVVIGCMSSPPRVLVTGGSGYAGQFIAAALLQAGYDVAYTFLSTEPTLAGCEGFRVDLTSSAQLGACLAKPPCAVVNCAALSQPASCERDPGAACSLNVPSVLLQALAERAPEALVIHLSTDQVFAGTRAFSSEADADADTPVNAYGASKRAAEVAVRAWPAHAILRPSIILGPQPPTPVTRPLFLQWLAGALAAGPVDLFEDEWRSPVHVLDLAAAVVALVDRRADARLRGTYNLGGPERLSRADMGDCVAALGGHPRHRARRVPSASVARPVASPADISMDSGKVQAALGLRLRSFAEAAAASLSVP